MTEENIIATASATVQDGRAETSALTYKTGKSRSDLMHGQEYCVTAKYLTNDNYESAVEYGTLVMLSCNTTTTIEGPTNIGIGEDAILTITVRENNHNNILDTGWVTVYDGNEIIQQNYAVTGNIIEISFNTNVAGTHTIYAIYEPESTYYNSSNSNDLDITVGKTGVIFDQVSMNTSDTEYNVNSGGTARIRKNQTYNIGGVLITEDDYVTLEGQEIILLDYNGSVVGTTQTDEYGGFGFTYSTSDSNADFQHISLVYEGTNEYESKEEWITIVLSYLPHCDNFITSRGTYMNQPWITVVPVDDELYQKFEQGEFYLPEIRQTLDNYQYTGKVFKMHDQIGYKSLSNEFWEGEQYYFTGYIDPQIAQESESDYLFLAVVEVDGNGNVVSQEWYYNDDAQQYMIQEELFLDVE